jgi:hypothetical protein
MRRIEYLDAPRWHLRARMLRVEAPDGILAKI